MSSSLPRYLSVALGKRLSTRGVEVIPYAQVRYIGGPSTFAFLSTSEIDSIEPEEKEKNDAYYSSPKNAKIGIYLSRVYDSLHTNMLYTDKVALFSTSVPYANQGPPLNCSEHFASKAGLEVGSNGGFVVNRCMLASEGVYIAGDIANVRMPLGRGVFTGVDHAHHTGLVAGRNMSGVFDIYDHIPIYEGSAEESAIHLTFVGHCSSAFETHGFWWKVSSETASSSSEKTSSSSEKKKSKGLSSSSPQEETILDRIKVELYSIFGMKYKAPSRVTKAIEATPQGKLNVRIIKKESSRLKSAPPLGLGVLFYIDNDIVVGVLISGTALSKQRNETNDRNDNEDEVLSYSEVIHERARSYIGKPLAVVTASIEAEYLPENESTDFRSGRLIKLQNLNEIASYIIAPAVLPPDDSGSIVSPLPSHIQGEREGDKEGQTPAQGTEGPNNQESSISNKRDAINILKLEQKRIFLSLPKSLYRYSPANKAIMSAYSSNEQIEMVLAPSIMHENIFHTGGNMTGTRADKLTAAYTSALNIGPGTN